MDDQERDFVDAMIADIQYQCYKEKEFPDYRPEYCLCSREDYEEHMNKKSETQKPKTRKSKSRKPENQKPENQNPKLPCGNQV